MTPQSIPAVGIDLGTTFSVLARLDETNRPVTLVNAEGEHLTPSVVLFDGDNVVVGREALKAIAAEADHVAECSKRDIGHRAFHKTFDGKQLPPEVIEAWVLARLRRDAGTQIGPFQKVVITVPAYFDEVRRKATQDAGYMAGLDVIDIINEPTAAALAFGYQEGYLRQQGAPAPQRILVYDLGGGTFDVTVMEIRGNQYRALAIDGDVRLGGYDWDQRLVDLVAEAFIQEHFADPREDPTSAAKLWRDCEDAKRTLSARSKVSIPCHYRGFSSRITITRQQFEEATLDLLDRTRFTTMQVLRAARAAWNQIDRVLLVGGSTRMPMVRHMLHQLSGHQPDASVAADEAVAHGAAIHAGVLLAQSQGQPPALSIKNVNAHSLGVVGTDPATKRRRAGILIPRNTPLPASAQRTFRTQKENQRSLLVEVVEGESPSPDDCTPIGRCSVHHLPPDLPAQSPVEILFHYQPNGRLKVRVAIPSSTIQVETVFHRDNGLPKEDLDSWRERISGQPPTDYT